MGGKKRTSNTITWAGGMTACGGILAYTIAKCESNKFANAWKHAPVKTFGIGLAGITAMGVAGQVTAKVLHVLSGGHKSTYGVNHGHGHDAAHH
jgi:hypothetical protein